MSTAGMENFAYLVGAMKNPEIEASEARERQAAAANAAQLQLFHLSRGSEGSAFLPEYLRAGEAAAGRRAMDTSAALRSYYGTPEDVVGRGAAVAARASPLLDLGTKSIYGIYSGEEEAKRMAAAAPVMAARRGLAETTATGSLQGISERLNAIRAQNAAKGFVGAGSGSERLGLQAAIEGNQQAAGARGAAELANAADTQAIRNQILDLQLRSPELAGQLAAQYASMELLPGQVAGAINRAETSPYDYFRIGVGSPPQQVMAPWAQPMVSPLGGIMAGAGANAESLARYYANRDLANRYGGGAGYRQPGGYNPYAYGGYNQGVYGQDYGTTDYGSYSDFPESGYADYPSGNIDAGGYLDR